MKTSNKNNISTTSNNGVYEYKKNNISYLITKSPNIKNDISNEKLIQLIDLNYYRIWDPYKSKLGALYKKKIEIPNLKNLSILYLGASFGTTVSHISDILFEGSGIVYAVEFSDIPMRSLLLLSKYRLNIIPIFSDAYFPESYLSIVNSVDLIFQDISQPNQVNIAIKNCNLFLKKNGCLILIIKARSINSFLNVNEIYNIELKKISDNKNIKILKTISLDPFHRDHLCVIA